MIWICVYCNGEGWYSETAHNPGCTGDRCVEPCPVQVQVHCPNCGGSGRDMRSEEGENEMLTGESE